MKTLGWLAAATVAAVASPLSAQVLHTNNQWDDCAIVIDPALTQAAWHQFVDELGLVAYFRPLAAAKPLGRGRFELAILNWGSRIDDADPAWNDTFSHPDSTHWLFEGDALLIPGLMLRGGVAERVDLGAYFTKNPNANYGILGGQVQYSFVNDVERGIAAAGRLSITRLFGPDDLTAGVYSLDVLASKDWSVLSPYVGVSGYLSRGHERTSKVALDDESVFGAQGAVGVAASVWALRLGAEYYVARVSGYSFKIAYGF